jgi:hypothetical protein
MKQGRKESRKKEGEDGRKWERGEEKRERKR